MDLNQRLNGNGLRNPSGRVKAIGLVISAVLITGLLIYGAATVPADTTSGEQDYPFALAEQGVNYSFKHTLNCQFVISGNIEYSDESAATHDNTVIMIQPLGTYDDRPPATVLVGGDKHYGEYGWSQLLVGNYWYLVWVQDVSSNAPLSAKILVDNLDCAGKRTLAVVNFRQMLPL